jgi:RNA polymerase sigma-70 factor (ECF subfamily)
MARDTNPIADDQALSHGAVTPNSSSAELARRRLSEFEHHRTLLFAVAYRMVGSAADAEDLLQEAFIRWQRTCETVIESPRAFLVTIVTRLCINHMRSRDMQHQEYVGQWLPEPLLTSPQHDPLLSMEIDESLSLAFLLLLERLNPIERAVLVLREAFDYEYSEIASILEQSEANCRQILRRARQRIREDRRRFEASQSQREELLLKFINASARSDLQGLIAVLSEDAVFYSDGGRKGPALPNPIYGPENIARGLLGAQKKLVPANLVARFVQVNGRPAVVAFLDGRPFSVFTIEVSDGLIVSIYVINNQEKLRRFPPLSSFPS